MKITPQNKSGLGLGLGLRVALRPEESAAARSIRFVLSGNSA